MILDILNDKAPSVDIFGSNAYRGGNFGSIWTEVKTRYNKPVMYTEYGDLNAQFPGGNFDVDRQKDIHEASWLNILSNLPGGLGQGNAIGGFAFDWVDNWWQSGKPNEHNLGSGAIHNEWHGITSQGDGSNSPYIRHVRPVYETYQTLWNPNLINQPPAANAGDDNVLNLASGGQLSGSVTDDNVPVNAIRTILWEKKSGPGDVLFSNVLGFNPRLNFTRPGIYELRFTAFDGEKSHSNTVRMTVHSNAGGAGTLARNIFNPARGENAEIAFVVTQPSQVEITLYDRLGRKVKRLLDRFLPANNYIEPWNGRDGSGNMVSSGLYHVVCKIGGQTLKSKIVVSK